VIWRITGRKATGRKPRQWYVYILLENQSTPNKTILLRSFLYILSLYDTLWRQSSNDRLHNLVAAVFLLERQQDEEGLARAILEVIDYLQGEDMPAIRDLMDWIDKLFVDGTEPAAVQKLRNLGGAQTMLSELAKKVNQNAVKAAKAENAYLEGELKGKLDTAKALLRDGVPLKTVIRCTGLTEEQLAREMQKDSGV